jgi:hypothetical protein
VKPLPGGHGLPTLPERANRIRVDEETAGMGWSTVELAGKPADWFVPQQGGAGRTALFLHGYDGVTLRNSETYSAALERQGLQVLCPHGNRCWWSDAVYPPFDPAISPVQFLAREVPAFLLKQKGNPSPSSIAVFGIEMGGQGALQLAYRHARTFPVVVAISPKVDFEDWHGHGTTLDEIFPDRESARQATATLHIHPLDWPRHQLLLCDPADVYCRDGVEILASKLSSSGIPFEDDLQSSHGGYGWNYAKSMAERVVNYLSTALEQESRRRN